MDASTDPRRSGRLAAKQAKANGGPAPGAVTETPAHAWRQLAAADATPNAADLSAPATATPAGNIAAADGTGDACSPLLRVQPACMPFTAATTPVGMPAAAPIQPAIDTAGDACLLPGSPDGVVNRPAGLLMGGGSGCAGGDTAAGLAGPVAVPAAPVALPPEPWLGERLPDASHLDIDASFHERWQALAGGQAGGGAPFSGHDELLAAGAELEGLPAEKRAELFACLEETFPGMLP